MTERPLTQAVGRTTFVRTRTQAALLDDPTALQAHDARDSYLFVRDIVPAEAPAMIFDSAAGVLVRWESPSATGATSPRWTRPGAAGSYDPLDLPGFEMEELSRTDALAGICERLYGNASGGWEEPALHSSRSLATQHASRRPIAMRSAAPGSATGDCSKLWLPLAPVAFADGETLAASRHAPGRDPRVRRHAQRQLPEFKGASKSRPPAPRSERRAKLAPAEYEDQRRPRAADDDPGRRMASPGRSAGRRALLQRRHDPAAGCRSRSETVRLSLQWRGCIRSRGQKPHQIPLGERLRQEREELLSTT